MRKTFSIDSFVRYEDCPVHGAEICTCVWGDDLIVVGEIINKDDIK